VFQIAGETLHVYFLGTAAALPTTNKNPSSIMIRRGSDTILFDCGEGTQQQMMRAKTGFVVDAVFITHWHADHFLGVLGLTQTMSFIGRTDPLDIYGPKGVQEFAAQVRNIGNCHINFPLRAHVLADGDSVRFDGYSIRAFSVDHHIRGLGYALIEDDRPGRFDRECAVELGIRPGPDFGRLQRGETVTITDDNGEEKEIVPSDVMGAPRPGRKVVYTGDTRPVTERMKEFGEGADLLIHDATYDDSEQERAREVYHSTAGEAGDAAEELNVIMLALTHISSRYTSTANHIQDANNNFKGQVIAPDDREVVQIPFRG